MSFLDGLLRRRRLIGATTVLLAVAGVGSWLTMPREEDPQFPHRDGTIITVFPGADAETVERLVVEPIEEHLAEVEQIVEVTSTARAGVAIQHVEMRETVYDTESAWDEVEDALEEAREDFPAGVGEPDLDDDLVSQEAVVYAVVGSADPLTLLRGAKLAKRRLVSIDSVKEVNLVADPGEQITIEYDDATARRLGLASGALGVQLAQRSLIVPGGVIHLGAKTANLRPQTEFRSLDEIRATPILLPSGSSVPLGELARVRQGPAEPANELMRWNGEPAIGVAVVPQDGLDRVRFGDQVRARVALLAEELAPLELAEVVFQPDLVESRLDDLTASLRLGILIVAAVLFLAMGPRLGVVVALVVPLVAFASIAVFAAGGGILHQISIASLVIALGMLVDNAIVVVENIQYRLDQGRRVHQAAVESVKELALPLGTATGTTLAAFVPMLISKGNTADFTRSVPVMIMLTLTVSYVFAILVTPVLSEMLLRPRKEGSGPSRSERLADALAGLAVRRSGWVLVGAVVLLAASVLASRWVDLKFFPAADRQTVVVELEMPEGTHLEATDEMARQVESWLLADGRVRTVATFVGRNGPKFYYNLVSRPNSPHLSMLMAEARSIDDVEPLIAELRQRVRRELPKASLVARRLEQGPPVEAPVELRVMGYDLEDMEQVADALLGELRAIDGTRDVRHDLGLGVPTVVFEIDDAAAGRHGLSRTDVASALLGRTLGAEIGQFRVGEDPVPILVRSSAGEEFPAADLGTIDVATPSGHPVPLSQLARLRVEWRPAAIQHKDRQRMVKVQAQLAEGYSAHGVFGQLEPRLAELELPAGVRIERGGELEESGKANSAILQQMPLGLLLLLFFLLLEFNSFRRVAIIMVTVPLAAVGVVPGLILSGQPFGFMSLLGVVSLVGIVVNNAIVLLDVIESRRQQGSSVDQALAEAVRRRTRPILLTMATTVAGLSPLAFSSATLWPPLAWAMISGLAASTVLTLLVIPALYRLLFARPTFGQLGFGRRSAALAGTLLLLAVGSVLFAQRAAAATTADEAGDAVPRLSLEQAMERAAQAPRAAAADLRARGAGQRAVAERRRSRLPTLGLSADAVRRDRDFEFDTPIGGFTLGERTSVAGAVQLSQPLLDPVRRRYLAPAAERQAEGARWQAERSRRSLAAAAAARFLDVLAVDADLAATAAFVDSLGARLEEMEQKVRAGRTLEAEALKVRLDLESAQLDASRLGDLRRVAVLELGRAVGADGAVEPDWHGDFDRGGEVDEAAALAAAVAGRSDLRALAQRLAAAELAARAVVAEGWPRLDASVTYQASDGDPFRADELLEGAVSVRWTPFDAGTRAPRRAAAEVEVEALRLDLAELRRAVAVELRRALADLATARQAVAVRRRGVELAAETARVERERAAAGRATTNDLLDAEADLRRQRTELELSRLDVARAWVRYDLAVGKGPPPESP